MRRYTQDAVSLGAFLLRQNICHHCLTCRATYTKNTRQNRDHIKANQAEIAELKEENEALKAKVVSLEERLAAVEAKVA